jgi:hypothetical protein
MDRRTTGIIATVVATMLCGCPGLCLLVFGAVSMVVPFTYTDFNGDTFRETLPAGWGIAGLCLALLFIAIPVVVAFLTLRRRPDLGPAAAGATVYTPPGGPGPVSTGAAVYTPPSEPAQEPPRPEVYIPPSEPRQEPPETEVYNPPDEPLPPPS